MSNRIQAQVGQPAWQPTEDSELVAVRHFWDVPLIGVLHQNKVPYLFACVSGGGERSSFWAYVALTEAEEAEFIAGVPDSLNEDVRRFLTTDELVVTGSVNYVITFTMAVERQPDFHHFTQAVRVQLAEVLAEFESSSAVAV